MKQRIGWIGTGVMGHAMCGHLLAAGHDVRVFNRTRSKTQTLIDAGATWCDTPAKVAENCDAVFTIVGYPADVESVILGPDGVLAGCDAGCTIVDMTTSEPTLAERICTTATAQSVHALDAPVSGGDVGAQQATLSIMVGGDEATFKKTTPLLELMGKTITYMGAAGSGQHTKMCNQTLAAGNMIGMVEALLYAQATGLDAHQVIRVIGSGAASSWAINTLGPRIADGDFEPGFFIKHFVKDMGIVLSETARRRLELPGLTLVHRFYTMAMDAGLENAGTQGLYRVLADMNGLELIE